MFLRLPTNVADVQLACRRLKAAAIWQPPRTLQRRRFDRVAKTRPLFRIAITVLLFGLLELGHRRAHDGGRDVWSCVDSELVFSLPITTQAVLYFSHFHRNSWRDGELALGFDFASLSGLEKTSTIRWCRRTSGCAQRRLNKRADLPTPGRVPSAFSMRRFTSARHGNVDRSLGAANRRQPPKKMSGETSHNRQRNNCAPKRAKLSPRPGRTPRRIVPAVHSPTADA